MAGHIFSLQLRLGRCILLAICVAVTAYGLGCGGGSRGTGIYGVDGLRPGKLVEDDQRLPLYVEPEPSTTPTPAPGSAGAASPRDDRR